MTLTMNHKAAWGYRGKDKKLYLLVCVTLLTIISGLDWSVSDAKSLKEDNIYPMFAIIAI